ncbi:MAG: hypothetical protein ACJ8F1_08080 [Polyangia bacterium]
MADALGFASEFKVRQLEKEGRLHPIRGAMGSAWYPRAQVETVRRALPRPLFAAGPRARWTDAALIALLRERPRTVVDLVVDAGIPISRAERVYRWWRSHEAPPATTTASDDASAERRSGDRLEHDALVRQLRDADPKVRAAAFEQLKARR